MSEVLTPSPDELLAVSRAYVALSADKRKAFRARIKAKGIDASRLPIVPFPSRGARLPLSHAQERLWFLWRLDPHSAAYNIAGAVRIEGRLEVADVRLALEQMVARHESLSNTFIEEDDAVWQIAGQKNAAQKAYGWSELAPPAAGEGIADVLQGLARQPFDLIAGPLLRVTLIRCAEQEHVLHFSMHHIISDGWSMDVLNKEFSEACRAARSGAAASLSPLPIQYGDYTLWQRDWVDAEAMDKQLNFWRERLGSTQAVLELPLSRMRSGMRSGEGGREESLLAPALLAQLRALAQQHDASLFMLLLAAYDILLARYSGQQDIRIGVPAAGRERLETAPLIGFFVNTLVIRSELDGLLTFSQLLEHVRERVLEAHAHQDLPFARLVDALQPERSLSHSPLFQAMFNFSVVRDEDMALPGLRVSRLQGAIETSRFDLVLNVVDASTPVVAFNYSNDVLDAPVIRRLLGHYVEILTQLAAHGSMLPLGSLHLSQARGTEQEQARSRADYPFNPVAQRISARALAQPQAPALHCEGQRLSYGQLEQWASQVGRRLHEAGVRAEERVGLCVTRSVGMVAGLLGIFKSGGAFLPLDPDYPADRLALMLEDAGVRTVLADADTATQLADVLAGYQVIRIDQLDGVSDQPFHMPVLADQLAYVIYTSGSTGRPKGVAISQRALSLHLDDFLQTYGISAQDKQLQSSTINFDVALHEMLPALIQGGQVEMRGAQPWDLETTSRQLAQEGVTFSRLATAYWQQWLRNPPSPASLAALRQITVGGEGLPGDALRQWRAGPLQHIRLDNLYGPTETTVACMYRQTCAADTEQAIVSIGQAYPSRSVYVMDAEGNEAPDGGLGELCIAGDTLARGYLGRAALTAEKFIPDPYRADGARLYRSGDLCRRREDGSIAFLGRIDQQVKLRGFRIELGEIEAVLRQTPGVQDAVVELCGEGEGKRLVGYVVGTAAHDDIRAVAQTRLPGYMVPSALVSLERLPLMPNGKVDRKALPQPQQEQATRQLVGPANQTQATLLAIWREVLGREDIGVTDNFFEAGGDSILSLRIISRAAQAGLKLTPRQVFENPDIVRLAALATSHDTTHKPEVLTSLPLTPIQQAFFERYPQGQSHWNQSLLLKVDGALERTALAAALAHLVRSFDALRLRFLRSEAGWRQQVQPADSAAPSVLSDIIDLRGQPDWRAQLEQQGAALQRSLDIEHGPLIRAAYFALDGEARLLLTIHHLAVDGVSWRVLLDTLQQAYQQVSQGRPAPELVATPWSVWVAESVDSARHVLAQQELPWWQARLTGAGNDSETTAAATASPAQQQQQQQRQPHRRRLQFNAAITEQLLSQPARVYGAGLDEFLLTALGRSIAAHSGAQQLLVSLEGHGREAVDSELDLSNSVGWFTARFPLCLEIHDDAAAALIATKENLRSVPHKGVRWGWLRTYGDAATRAAVAALPAPAINFNYLGQFDQSLQRDGVFHFADEPFGAAMADEGSSAYALDFSAVVAAGALTVDWRLAPASWSIEAADRMVADFERQVHALLQHCQSAAPVRTASDFALAGLSQPSLQELLSAHLTDLPAAAIADIYPATPLQTGLLYHSLTQAGQGLYLIQKRLSLTGALNPEAMRGAWQLAVTRHAILRTRFVWQHGGAPLQVVAKNSDLPFVQHDWRSLDAAAYEQRMQHWLAQDLAAGFDAGVAPLLRINLFARADGHCDLVWTGHHLLTDGWSSAQLLGEVMQAYRLLNAGQPVTMDAPAPYRDYVVWLRRQPDASAWWQSRLSEVRDPANLGSCLSAPAVDINAGIGAEQATVALRPELSERLAQTARRHRVTVNTLIQGAWALLLARFGNRDQVVFGVTVSGRPHDLPGMERMLGLFINSLPLWLEVPAAMRLSAWLAGIQERNSALRQYEHTDLGQIQQWAGQSGASLFDSLLVFENYPVDEEMRKEATGLTLERYQAVERSHYPLVLTAGPGRSLTLNWKWDPARLDQQTIAAWSAAYLAVLEQFAGAEDVCVGEIAVDSAPAQQQVLAWSRPTTTAPKLLAPRSELLHVLIEQQAARQPAAIAVVGEHGQQLSYAELNTRANHLAWRLIDMGVAPEVKVGLAFARSADMLVAMLAVLKAGGAYVPLDPEYPQERLAYMIGDSAIGLILSESSVRAHLPALDAEAVRVLELDRLSDPDQRSHNPQVLQHQDALAYVIYTSGSTGRPKGAQLTHRNVARLLSGTEQHFAFSSSDVWTLFHSYAFDFSVWEIFGALCHGGRLIVVPFAVSRAPADFLDLLRRQGVTVLNQTPSAFRQLLEVPELYRAEDLALRLVIFGGEALEPRTLRPWLAHFGDQRVQLVNMYGITETTVHVTYRRILQTDLEGRASPVGAQIADLGLYVLDVHGRLAAVGVAGELFVAGDGLARGYLHRAALTAERFVPDPFSAQGGRLYRTGDLARRTADGQLEYLGRIDQQVKIRGFRIEIGEVEAQLLALPQVREACVLADQGPSGTRLIAYVTAASAVVGATLDAQQLRTQLAARLPDYMLPAALMVLAKLPLTPNGKIDRRALPAAAVDAGVGAGPAYVAPQGEVEQQLALVWQEVLELEQVGRTDNFFALGGDSILSLQVVARARKRGVEITPKQLFETPTVAGLAQALALPRAPAMLADSLKLPATADYSAFALAKLSQQDLLRLPIVLAEVQDIYPATPLQNGMLFHSLLQNGQGVYIDQNCFTLVGPLDLAALNTAWSVAVQRHDILRTHFRWEHGGDALQVVQRQAELALTLHDWSDRSQAAYAAELAAWRAVDLAAGFALDCAPLLRINLFVRPDGRHDCVSTNHHVLLDGWSYAQLVGEVMHVYQAEAKHQPYQLGAPGAYRDYIAWMAAQPSVRDWWMARYARVDAPVGVGASVLSASASSLYASDRLKHIVQELDLDATAALEAAAKRHQVSINTLVQGAWALLLGRYGNRDQAAFGVTVSGRPGDLPEIEKVLGLFINSLPLWVSLPAGDGVGAWLSALQGDNYALREHGYASVSQLQQWTGLSGEALFDSLVVFENYPIDRALRDGLQDLRIEGYQITERTHYPMVLVAVPASRFRFRFKFDAARISDAMATQLAQHFLELLQQLMQAQPELPLGSLQLSVTRDSATARADYPYIPVAQRISARALAQPQAPALHCEGQRLSYGQLEQWASQVGRRLHDDGVQAEERVGLCVTRSVAMVAGLLGIFKSGGAFLPLDPDYPPDRLALMLDDAGVRTVVADADTATQLADVLAGRKVLRLDQLNGVSTKPFQLPVLADQLAYVIYTSGSTGKPKGVAISQRALSLHLDDFIQTYGISEQDKQLQSSTINFDVALHEMLPALIQGGQVEMRGTQAWDLETTSRQLAQEGVTFSRLATAYWQQWLRNPPSPASLAALRQITVGGEGLPGDALRQWRAGPLQHIRLDNLYGPTETTVACMYRQTCAADTEQAIVSIGQAYPSRSVYVMDAEGNEAPDGGLGELCIAGDTLARGYLGRAALTAEKFIPDPYRADGARLYRSGDLCRRREDGSIAFLGRIDQQVKLRGFRIELGEIEAVLRQTPGVQDAVVELCGEGEGKRLVGYVVGTAAHDDIRAVAQTRLPGYMVPSALVNLERLPLMPNGKVDRKALPQPQQEQATRQLVGPANQTQATLLAIWREVLGREDIGVTDNFFEAGGDSIAALRLAEAARRHGIAGYTLELLFNFPDIAAATHAMQDQSRNFPSNILPLNAGPQSHKLFAIHPGYGLVAPYRELARHLEDRVCVYGVQSPLYAEPDWWPSSIAALAQDYTRRIRQVQPEGPYLLLGWSVGGQIATQVAAVLEAAGQQVSFLGLIDSYVRVAAPDALAPLARPPVDPAALERFMAQMAQEEPVWTRRLGQGAEGHTLAAQAMQVRDHFETLPGREHALALQVQASLWLARASLPGAAQDSVDSWRQASGAVVELQGVIDTDHTGVIHDATLLAQLHERLTQLLAGVA